MKKSEFVIITRNIAFLEDKLNKLLTELEDTEFSNYRKRQSLTTSIKYTKNNIEEFKKEINLNFIGGK